MIRKLTAALAASMSLAACASDDYRPWLAVPGAYEETAQTERFTLARTACYGFCPVYTVTVTARDILTFEGERFVTEQGGAVSKRLPDGAFETLLDIAERYDFAAFDPRYPNAAGDNCESLATDMPSIIITAESKRLTHAVALYQGCIGAEGRERFNAMALEMDAVFDIADWIGPREAFYGDAEAEEQPESQ